jgi:hypothetical protein
MLTTGKRGIAWIDELGLQNILEKRLFKRYLLRRLSIILAMALHDTSKEFQQLERRTSS